MLPAPAASNNLKAAMSIASSSVPFNLASNKAKKAGKLSGPFDSATIAFKSASLTLVPNSWKQAFSS